MLHFNDVAPGHEFPPLTIALDAASVARYLAATDDDTPVYWRDGRLEFVPPLAVAALAFQEIAQSLPAGSIHTAQEFAFRRPIRVGERLSTRLTVATASRRRDFMATALDVAIVDDIGEIALSGRMTLLIAGADQGAVGGGQYRQATAEVAALAAPRAEPYGRLEPLEIGEGTALPVVTRTVTQEVIERYAVASGDHNPIHVDPEVAARSQFGGTVAHGMLLLAYLSTVLTRAFGLAYLDTGSLKVKFRAPALSGMMVTARGRVERVEEGDGVQYALCAVGVESAAGDNLIAGEARVDVKRVQ